MKVDTCKLCTDVAIASHHTFLLKLCRLQSRYSMYCMGKKQVSMQQKPLWPRLTLWKRQVRFPALSKFRLHVSMCRVELQVLCLGDSPGKLRSYFSLSLSLLISLFLSLSASFSVSLFSSLSLYFFLSLFLPHFTLLFQMFTCVHIQAVLIGYNLRYETTRLGA